MTLGYRPEGPDGLAAALVILLPGYRETLRINGRLRGDELVVEEAFLHCAKCMIRSRLWDEEPAATTGPEVPAAERGLEDPDVAAFLARSPFVTLTSTDAANHMDVSPKGDPAGFVVVVGPNQLALPDRPGNRRTDTFHNLIEHPEVAMLAFVPGDDRVLRVRGRASISQDEALRARGEVKGHLPAVMLVIDVAEVTLERTQAMSAAGLWDPSRRISSKELPRASRIWTDHVKLNDDPGVAARVARLALRERVMRASLDADYQNNLY